MTKARLLIPLALQFCVRIIIRTGFLQRISEFVQPIIALGWEDDELRKELEELGAEVYLLPKAYYSSAHRHLRNKINYWWNAKYLKSPSAAIDERMSDAINGLSLPKAIRRKLMRASYCLRYGMLGQFNGLIEEERRAFLRSHSTKEFETLVKKIKPDVALSLTPYIRDEEALIRVAKLNGLPSCAPILSFDNIVSRGWFSIIFDRYFLWNRYNEAELRRGYPDADCSEVVITGAPQFDFYWDSSYLWDEKEWRGELGLPENKPVILFGGGYYTVAPHEQHWLNQLDEAIENGEIVEKPIILFRSHPVDPIERWLPVLKNSKHIVHDPPWPTGEIKGRTNVQRRDIEKLASTLYHSQIHINTSSTMTVDGAIFDRPQIGPAYDDRPGQKFDRVSKELYLREHFLPITRSGGLQIVCSRQEMIAAVNDALQNPTRFSRERGRLVREIITYDDGQCTGRFVDALRAFINDNGRTKPELSLVEACL